MSPYEYVLKELAEKLAHHQAWSSFDFAFLQFLVWSSILASAGAAFLAAIGSPYKWLTAALAVVPALAITAESNLSFSGRYKFHDQYVVELAALNRRLIVEKVDPKAISAELTNLERDMESKFPAATVVGKDPAKPQAPARPASPVTQ